MLGKQFKNTLVYAKKIELCKRNVGLSSKILVNIK